MILHNTKKQWTDFVYLELYFDLVFNFNSA